MSKVTMAFEMQTQSAGATKGGSSTQGFLAISEIRDDVIVTREGGLRAIVAVSSTNFILKSQDEQTAIIARYQAFLNSLEFPIQLLMQSRHMDIHGYLQRIRERQLQLTNELLRVQTEEYIAYISKLLEFGNIMNKTFYAIVPLAVTEPIKAGFVDKLKNLVNPTGEIVASQQKFAEHLSALGDRVARVESGLSSVGLRTMRLSTQELIELLYNSYNVSILPGMKLDIEELKLG